MKLYFDLENRQLIDVPGFRNAVTSLKFKRGDTCAIAIQYVIGTVVQELAAGATGVIGLKSGGNFNGDFIASAGSWAKTGTGTATTYTFELNLSTTAINALLTGGAASIPALFELEFVAAGVRTSSQTILATICNDVVKGDETGPVEVTPGIPVASVAEASASATVTFTGSLTSGDTLTISGVVYSATSLLTPTPPVFFKNADGFAIAVNAYDTHVTAVAVGSVITLTAKAPGAAGNAITLAKSGANISISGGTRAGGADEAFTPGRVGTMKVSPGFLYVVDALDGNELPVWKKAALSNLV